MKITFEELPDSVAEIHAKLNNIEALLISIGVTPPVPQADQLLTIKQAADFIKLSVSTLYGLVHKKSIPVCKRGKRLYFSQKELFDWIKDSRQKTAHEINLEADIHLHKLYNK